ncbi:acyl carrier protein [Streptomyces tendae]|uniref:acyl carrier protein n=1 Tax=Streptomyces tendae TaxID=1932 RepID=UPI0037A1BCB5
MQDTDQTTEHIRSIVADILDLNPDEIHDDQDLTDTYRADSLNLIEIVTQLEKHYQTELPLNKLHHTHTINTLRNLLHTQLNQTPNPNPAQ